MLFLGTDPKERKAYVHADSHTNVHSSFGPEVETNQYPPKVKDKQNGSSSQQTTTYQGKELNY